MTTPHKQWLDNEYAQWVKALSECTVHNFKEHPGVRRMLSLDLTTRDFDDCIWNLTKEQKGALNGIEDIGYRNTEGVKRDHFRRIIYYAQQILKLNPSSIVEIGGGVGQFYATLRALGWMGEYWIFDLPEVQEFQYRYLHEVQKITSVTTEQRHVLIQPNRTLISFYSLGEFDDKLKESYRGVINDCKHGYIAWNPHSGANDDLGIFSSHDITITPGIEEGVKIITW